MLPAAPVLIAQGRRLRRDTPRLPDAAHPWQGTLDGPEPLQLLVLGDSTAAGVGAATVAAAGVTVAGGVAGVGVPATAVFSVFDAALSVGVVDAPAAAGAASAAGSLKLAPAELAM